MVSTKERKSYYQNLIARTGVCDSVRQQNESTFEELMLLLNNHPSYASKVYGTVDIKIRRNRLNPVYFELNVIKMTKDSQVVCDSVSYNACLQPVQDKHAALKKSMRNQVAPQLIAFKKRMPHVCVLCSSEDRIEVDHHRPKFRDLYHAFIKGLTLPSTFDRNTFNSVCFQVQDREFAERWTDYHKKNAVLRLLCRACNLRTAN